jgi:hypothetical protein
MAWLSGCAPVEPSTPDDVMEQVLSFEAVRPPSATAARYLESEPNDEFEDANGVGTSTHLELYGTMAAGDWVEDRDVFDLGPVSAGDRIQADIAASVFSDIQLALFDEDGHLLQIVIPSSPSNGPGSIDIVARESTSALYAVIATRSSSSVERNYTVQVTIDEGHGLPPYQPQIVVLNFEGAEDVQVGLREPVDIPAFDAYNLGPSFGDETNTIVDLVLSYVKEDYNGLTVAFYLSDDPHLPAGDHSTVYFGTYDDRLLGLAENIDPYNRDRSQVAVIYTDTFALFNVLSPTTDEMAQVLANVTSHEVGHLLGLRHTENVRSIMDITASARQMLLDQWFMTASLHPTVMSIGAQDGPALLAQAIGGVAPIPPSSKVETLRRALELADDPDDFYIPRHMLSNCSSAHHHEGHEGTDPH